MFHLRRHGGRKSDDDFPLNVNGVPQRTAGVLLLSGGEKSLTAMALLMSIFHYQPSPFCILDEVDAPLDEPNIMRLTRLIKEMSGQTQFIVITHAMALLMSIFHYQPSPFCILDEVDAPLDEPNIMRLTRLLKEMSGQTQFIVITHAKRTMEAAQALYGVTMQEPGVSKLVSVRFEQPAVA
jgi:chromosome segregation ATPase